LESEPVPPVVQVPAPIDSLAAATAIVTALSGVIDDLRGEVVTLALFGRRNRNLIRAIAASVALDIILSLGLGYGLHQEHNIDVKATEAREAIATNQFSGCLFGNESRAAQKRIFDAIFAAALAKPPPGETAADKIQRLATVASIQDLVTKAYGSRDCGPVPK
jgi:hypothetical protein